MGGNGNFAEAAAAVRAEAAAAVRAEAAAAARTVVVPGHRGPGRGRAGVHPAVVADLARVSAVVGRRGRAGVLAGTFPLAGKSPAGSLWVRRRPASHPQMVIVRRSPRSSGVAPQSER